MEKSTKRAFFVILVLMLDALACRIGGESEPLLGKTYQLDEGGFILQEVIGYSFDDIFGIVNMTAPDGQTEVGPGIMVMGGLGL